MANAPRQSSGASFWIVKHVEYNQNLARCPLLTTHILSLFSSRQCRTPGQAQTCSYVRSIDGSPCKTWQICFANFSFQDDLQTCTRLTIPGLNLFPGGAQMFEVRLVSTTKIVRDFGRSRTNYNMGHSTLSNFRTRPSVRPTFLRIKGAGSPMEKLLAEEDEGEPISMRSGCWMALLDCRSRVYSLYDWTHPSS